MDKISNIFFSAAISIAVYFSPSSSYANTYSCGFTYLLANGSKGQTIQITFSNGQLKFRRRKLEVRVRGETVQYKGTGRYPYWYSFQKDGTVTRQTTAGIKHTGFHTCDSAAAARAIGSN